MTTSNSNPNPYGQSGNNSGQPYGQNPGQNQGQWGAQSGQPYGGQAQNQPYGQQPGQQWGGQPQAKQGTSITIPSGKPAWTTWVYAGLALITLLTSFIPFLSYKAKGEVDLGGDDEYGVDFGTITFDSKWSANWWGSVNAKDSGEKVGYNAELDNDTLLILCGIAIIALFIAAAVLAFLKMSKFVAPLGIAAAAVQLIAVIIGFVEYRDVEGEADIEEMREMAADGLEIGGGLQFGWFLWLLLALAALAFSIMLLLKGEDGLLAMVSGNKSAAGQGFQQQSMAPQPGTYTAPGQSPQRQAPQQPQGQYAQGAQANQGWGSQSSGSTVQPQGYGQSAQQPQQSPNQPSSQAQGWSAQSQSSAGSQGGQHSFPGEQQSGKHSQPSQQQWGSQQPGQASGTPPFGQEQGGQQPGQSGTPPFGQDNPYGQS